MAKCAKCGEELGFFSPAEYIDGVAYCGSCAKAINQRKKDPSYQKELAARAEEVKALIDRMILTTCPHVDGYRAVKQYGLVFGETVFKNGTLKSIEASIDNAIAVWAPGDNELGGSGELIENARNFATQKMIRRAAEKGANAVIGIDSESTMGAGGIMHISIWGTAVKLEAEEASE